jgi:hypothetical protein
VGAEAGSRAEGIRFRTIGDLAARCGHYSWLESSLFALLGDRACGAGPDEGRPVVPEVRVVLSEMSARRALLAERWRDRLPVRAGVDAAALITPPPGPIAAAVGLLAEEPDPRLVLGGVVDQLLPRLLEAYRADLAQASPVSEGPVRAVLGCAIGATGSDIERGRSLLERVMAPGNGPNWLPVSNGRWKARMTFSQLHGHLDTPTTMFLQPLRAECGAKAP